MTSANFSRYGAMDLSALKNARPAAPTGPSGPGASGGASGSTGGAPAGGFVIDASEETFQTDIVERSMTVPVVVDFWADWCEPCKQLSPVLEKLAGEYAGRFVLAKIDIEQNQRIAQAASVQSIPFVVAILKGQLVPLFQGALPEAQVRQYLDELLKVASSNGVTGVAEPVGEAAAEEDESAEPASDPRYAEAEEALEQGDLDGAIAAYQKVLDAAPADAEAKIGLARAKLVRRTRDVDLNEARTAAAERPDDMDAQRLAADVDLLGGHVDDAFGRLLDAIRRTSGAERDAARTHLLELFEMVGPEDPRVLSARRALSAALF